MKNIEQFQNGAVLHFSQISADIYVLDNYGRTTFYKKLKFGIHADTTNLKVELLDEVDPTNRFKIDKQPIFLIRHDNEVVI